MPRRTCKVCKRPASQRDALWDAVWRHRETGRQQLLAVHGGACAEALQSQWVLTTEEEMTERKPTPAEAAVEETDATEAARAQATLDASQPGPVPAVIESDADPRDPDAEPITEAEMLGSESDLPIITTRDVVEWIRNKRPLPKFDPEDVARAIAWEIIQAPDLESALVGGDMLHAQNFLYQAITVVGVKWQLSDFEEQGCPVYAVMDTVDPTTGEHRLMDCGGMNVVAAFVKADLAREWPITIRFTEATTKAGRITLKTELVRERPDANLPPDQQQF